MRLRATVQQFFELQGSSSDDEEDYAAGDDAAWQPGSPEGSDAEDRGAPGAPAPAPGTDAAAPRRFCHTALAQSLLQLPAAHDTPAVLPPEALTQDWARDGGFDTPTLVCAGPGVTGALGMRMPPELDTDGTVSALAVAPQLLHLLDPSTPVPVIDVTTQSESASMPLGDWVSYFTSDRHDRLLNVVSLSLAGTPLEATLCAPRVVREADLVARAWPSERHDCPAVQLYALASPAGCVTDWHLDFGGSSVWYRIVAGTKVFALAPPTTHNLRAFVQWASSSRQSREFLGEALEDVHKYTVRAGELLLIPGGWPHAVVTPEDSVVVGGNFVHAANLGLQSLVWRIEDRLRVEASYRYPNFKALCWYAAASFCDSLPPAADEDAAVAKAERGGSKRISIKLREGDDADPDAADAGAEEADAAGGNLHYILSALKAEEEASSVAKQEEDAHAAGGAAGEQGCEPAAQEDIDPAEAIAAAAMAAAAAGEGECGIETAPTPEPGPASHVEAAAADSASQLTARETAELVKLCAQLNVWLKLANEDAAEAGVPADVDKPRSLLTRLQSRLRAAGLSVQALADRFDDAAEEIMAGGVRMRFRLRRRAVVDVNEPAMLPPAELRDDLPREPRSAPRAKAGAEKAAAAPASKAAACVKRGAGGSGVRDRLAKKLKISHKR